MKKIILLIPLILFFACNNQPDQPDEPQADTTIDETGQPRSMARAVTPGGQTYELLADGDSLFYKDTTVKIDYTYKTTERHPKKPVEPPTNTAPIARAGANQTLTLPTNTTKLDGSASTDAENNIKSFGWRKVSGPSATITDSNKSIATISNLVKGVYVFELRVADHQNAFTADLVRITVNDAVVIPPTNQAPVARASANPSTITLPANTVNLSAAASTDADGTIASWLWIQFIGPPANIANETGETTSVSGLTAGTYQFRVTVTDNKGAQSIASVTVTVNPQVTDPPDGQPISFSFTQIPYSNPDLNAPGRGVEDWHNQNRVNVPTEGTNTQRLDAYFRSQLTWAMLERGQGQYDMNPLINLLNSCISKRQKISIGIMTVYHDNEPVVISYDGARSSYPEYLHDLMQSESCKDWNNGSGWIPNYNSQHYLSRLKALHVKVNDVLETGSFQGIRYKDIVYSIDVRGYGNYGEWHNGGLVDLVSQIPSCAHATTASLKAIIEAHTSAFPNFQLSIIMTAFDANWLQHTKTSPEVAYYALTTSNAYGKLGWRRDNWGATDNYIRDLLENNTRSWNGVQLNSLIMNVWKYAPVTGEPMNTAPNEYGDMERQVRLYHATSFGNGNINQSVTTGVKNSIRAGSKASGYRLISTGGTFTIGANSIQIKNNWQNVGIAPTYENWNITYELVNSSGQVTTVGNSTFKLRLFLPASSPTTHTDNFQVSVPAGTYTLRMSVKDPTGYRQPLPLAISGRNSDGSYNLKTGVQR